MTTFIIIAFIITTFVVILFNSLIRKRNQCAESFSGIQVQMKRRYDLIPNLVEAVKGYKKYEEKSLETIIKARNSQINQTSISEMAKTEETIQTGLKSIFAIQTAKSFVIFPDSTVSTQTFSSV